ncbi:transmembrane protein 53-like [Pseudophryne corroboree]|uniref:transmembrane protein 53-like n=1 Tax=Pseudophryne corroboree TaxID=495146 RepID=UPI00308150A7
MMCWESLLCALRCAVCRTLSFFYTGHYLHYQTSTIPRAFAMNTTSGTLCEDQTQTTSMLPPNVKRYSNFVSLYINPSHSVSCLSSRPLLLFLPWLGSKSRSHEKYIQLYFKLGFDVLVAESSLLHFLWPKTGLEYAGQLVDLLIGEKDLCSRRLYLHAISIGGYLFAQMLVCSSKEQRTMLERIYGQVFDSLVIGSMEKMATGVARMITFPLLEPLVIRGTLLYFSLLKAQTADYYERGIQTFWDKPIHCPALFFYCMNDPMSDHATVEKVMQDWEKHGLKVQGKKWEDSVHAGHLRRHTQEYTNTLTSFLHSLLTNVPKSRL